MYDRPAPVLILKSGPAPEINQSQFNNGQNGAVNGVDTSGNFETNGTTNGAPGTEGMSSAKVIAFASRMVCNGSMGPIFSTCSPRDLVITYNFVAKI